MGRCLLLLLLLLLVWYHRLRLLLPINCEPLEPL